MIIKDNNGHKVEIKNSHWPLAENLFLKWNLIPNNKNEIDMTDVYDITSELSAWGIPWKEIGN